MQNTRAEQLKKAEEFLRQGDIQKARTVAIEYLNTAGMELDVLLLLGDTFAAEALQNVHDPNPFEAAEKTYEMARNIALLELNDQEKANVCRQKIDTLSGRLSQKKSDIINQGDVHEAILLAGGLTHTDGMSKQELLEHMGSIVTKSGLYHDHYLEWREKRIRKIVEIFGESFFPGKRIIELAAGHGDIGAQFAKMGSRVLCLEGREGNVRIARKKYADVENIEFVQCNLEGDFSQYGPCDLLINFGLLYHLKNFDAHLKCCMKMADHHIVETVVLDSSDPNKIILFEETAERSELNDTAIDGVGAYASPFYIERLYEEEGFRTERHFTEDLNCTLHIYDWPHKNDDGQDQSNRRFWYFQRDPE